MNFRHLAFVPLAWLLWIAPPATAAAASEPLASFHWLGIRHISADTNAVAFLKVWSLPQTTNLLAQTLDKLSRWPGHGATNAASARLRPLLDDLVASEFYLEVDAATNSQSANGQVSGLRSQVSGFSLALRLPADRAKLWQTNLPIALPQVKVSSSGGWTLVSPGGWTLVSLGSDTNNPHSALRTPQLPIVSTNWLEADLTPAALSAFRFPLSAFVLPQVSGLKFQVSGDSGELLTRATLDFSSPLSATLPPWEIPTNLIHSPLTSFTAVRGLSAWLTTLPVWKNLQLVPAPDQVFVWAQANVPYVTSFAAPLPGASNQLSQLAGRLIPNLNPWLATNADGHLEWHAHPPGIGWHGVVILGPYVKAVVVNQHDFLLGGWFPVAEGDTNRPPAEILQTLRHSPGLVYYQTEHTGLRLDQDTFLSQLLRVIFQKAKLPLASAANVWLDQVRPLLGDSVTRVTQTGPEHLVFTRTSTLGLTALELHLFADWLESPQFPHGLHTFLAPPDQ